MSSKHVLAQITWRPVLLLQHTLGYLSQPQALAGLAPLARAFPSHTQPEPHTRSLPTSAACLPVERLCACRMWRVDLTLNTRRVASLRIPTASSPASSGTRRSSATVTTPRCATACCAVLCYAVCGAQQGGSTWLCWRGAPSQLLPQWPLCSMARSKHRSGCFVPGGGFELLPSTRAQ